MFAEHAKSGEYKGTYLSCNLVLWKHFRQDLGPDLSKV